MSAVRRSRHFAVLLDGQHFAVVGEFGEGLLPAFEFFEERAEFAVLLGNAAEFRLPWRRWPVGHAFLKLGETAAQVIDISGDVFWFHNAPIPNSRPPERGECSGAVHSKKGLQNADVPASPGNRFQNGDYAFL